MKLFDAIFTLASSAALLLAVTTSPANAAMIEAEDVIAAGAGGSGVSGSDGQYEVFSGWDATVLSLGGLGGTQGDSLLVHSGDTITTSTAVQLQFTGLDINTEYNVVVAVAFAPLVQEPFPRANIDPNWDYGYSYLSPTDAAAGTTTFGTAEFVGFTSKSTNTGASNTELNRNRSLFQLPNVTSNGSGEINLYLGNQNAAAGFVGFDTVELTAVPEPRTFILLGFGLAGLIACDQRNRS